MQSNVQTEQIQTACQVTTPCICFSIYKEILLSALKYTTLQSKAGFETAGTPRGEKTDGSSGEQNVAIQTIHCLSVQASGDPRFISSTYMWCSSS